MNKREKLTFLADIEDGYRPFDKHALRLLRALLDDPDAQVRSEAIACLWDDPDPSWIDVLMRKATEDPRADVRAHAVSALGRYVYEGNLAAFEGWNAEECLITPEDYARVCDFLFRLAQDPGEALEARRYAIEALAFREEDQDVFDLIDWAYQQRDRRFKASAVFAMARNGDPRWSDYILAELHSPDPEIQYEAVRAAGELRLLEATDTLIALARDKRAPKPLRLLAIYALGEAGDERAYAVLDHLTHSRDRDVRDVARDAIEMWIAITTAEEELMEDGMWDEVEEEEPFADDFQAETLPDIWDDGTGMFSRN